MRRCSTSLPPLLSLKHTHDAHTYVFVLFDIKSDLSAFELNQELLRVREGVGERKGNDEKKQTLRLDLSESLRERASSCSEASYGERVSNSVWRNMLLLSPWWTRKRWRTQEYPVHIQCRDRKEREGN